MFCLEVEKQKNTVTLKIFLLKKGFCFLLTKSKNVWTQFCQKLLENRFRWLLEWLTWKIKSNFEMPKRHFLTKVQRWMEQCFSAIRPIFGTNKIFSSSYFPNSNSLNNLQFLEKLSDLISSWLNVLTKIAEATLDWEMFFSLVTISRNISDAKKIASTIFS